RSSDLDAQSQFGVTGAGIVADIDTGVDPTHPALQGVLLPGYDFTRNQPGGSELADISSSPCPFSSCPPPRCPDCSSAQVNQSTAAVQRGGGHELDRKSTRLNSSHVAISYAVFCLKKKN